MGTVGEVLGRCCSSRVLVVISVMVVSAWSCLSLGGEVPLEMAVSHCLSIPRGFPSPPGVSQDRLNGNIVMGTGGEIWGRLCHIV